jgi:hypothetical protein
MRYLILILVCVFIVGCDGSRGSLPAGHLSAGEQIANIGFWFIVYGTLVAGLAVALRIAVGLGAAAFLGPFARFIPTSLLASIAETAGIIAITGAALQWIGEHFWIVTIACVLAGLAYVWWHRTDLRRWFHHGPQDQATPVPAPEVKPPNA